MRVVAPIVLVTGGARRIGRALCVFMAQRGFDVAVHYRSSRAEADALVTEIHALGRGGAAFRADLTDATTTDRLIASVHETMGPVRCLINNASVFTKDTLEDFSETVWGEHMTTNLYAPLSLIRDFAAQVRAAPPSKNMPGAQVINLVDGIFGWSMSAHFLSYSLSKLGLWTATHVLARELAPRIRINAIAPGPTLEGTQDREHTFEKLRAAAPLERTANVEEICTAVGFLLDSPGVTGQVINLSGGFHLMPQLEGM